MSIEKVNQAIVMMENSDEDILSVGSISESLIKEAELELGINFPDDYKYFIKKYGVLSFDSEEFYGITKSGLNSTSIPCVIFATKSARERGDISPQMIKIKSSGYGPNFSIDISQCKDGIAPVVETELSYKRDNHKAIVANSFGDFLLNEITDAIEDM